MAEEVGAPLADDHTHSEWSYDASAGSMQGSCEAAMAAGLSSIAFTEHVDHTRWVVVPGRQSSYELDRTGADGRFDPPAFDVDGYFAELERCRSRYRDLRILSGVELGEPHRFPAECDTLLREHVFDRILGSLHTVTVDDVPWNVHRLFEPGAPGTPTPAEAVRAYLEEARVMVESPQAFDVLAHLDYPVRRWPAHAQAFDATAFEEEFRSVLRPLAASGRALEINTRVPLAAQVVRWFYQEGGEAVSFGSDAHRPDAVATRFADAGAIAAAAGFVPGPDPAEFWLRRPVGAS